MGGGGLFCSLFLSISLSPSLPLSTFASSPVCSLDSRASLVPLPAICMHERKKKKRRRSATLPHSFYALFSISISLPHITISPVFGSWFLDLVPFHVVRFGSTSGDLS